MTYNKYANDSPIADNTGELVGIAEENLQALRNGIITGVLPDWDYERAGTAEAQDYDIWTNGDEQNKLTFTWGANDHITTIIPSWGRKGTWLTSGEQTLTWDADENLTAVTWGGTTTAAVINDSKPVGTDGMLSTIDLIRTNLMALRDGIVAGYAYNWDYSISGGTNEEPQYLRFDKGTERIQANLTWTDGAITRSELYYRPNSSTTYSLIGIRTMTYDADLNIESIIWSGTQTYTGFNDNKPIDSDTGSAVLTDIKTNQTAIRDALVLGFEFWNFSKSNGLGTASTPQYFYFKKGTLWIRATNFWGEVGGSDGNIATQIYDYSEDSGANYDNIGSLSAAFDSDGFCINTTWA